MPLQIALSRMTAFVRTMRWASVAGVTRNARAISSVVRPQISRRVSDLAPRVLHECAGFDPPHPTLMDHEVAGIWRPLRVSGRAQHSREIATQRDLQALAIWLENDGTPRPPARNS